MRYYYNILLLLSFIIISCETKINKDIVVKINTTITDSNIIIGDNLLYTVKIISKKDIKYEYEDISFDTRDYKIRIISKTNFTKEKNNFIEKTYQYKIGFYDIGQFVILPFKIEYLYNNNIYKINGEDTTILVHPFSDGNKLPNMKGVVTIPMPEYVWIIIIALSFIIVILIFIIIFIVKYIKKKMRDKNIIKEDIEALNSLSNIDYNEYYKNQKFAEYYFELTMIFKTYLSKRFEHNILDMTTSEVNNLFKHKSFKDSDYIINMLEKSDYIKFAKQLAEIDIMKKDYDFCKSYIIEHGNLYTIKKKEEKINKKENKKREKARKRRLKREAKKNKNMEK